MQSLIAKDGEAVTISTVQSSSISSQIEVKTVGRYRDLIFFLKSFLLFLERSSLALILVQISIFKNGFKK